MDKISLLKGIFRCIDRSAKEIDHYSVLKNGKKYILYAHFDKGDIFKKQIGSYESYKKAKADLDKILSLRLGSYGS